MKHIAARAAVKAGKYALKQFGKTHDIKSKGGTSFYSNVDVACEKIIHDIIQKKYPDHRIVSEESGDNRKKSPYTWYVDPLDGTHNFLKGLPLWGVSVAVAKHEVVQTGAMYLPFLKELYTAQRDRGAFCNGKKIEVSKKKSLKESFMLIDFALQRAPKLSHRIIKSFTPFAYDIRAFGCAVYMHALVASGKADGYFALKTNPWDFAAGFLIVEEAGGRVTKLDGTAWKPVPGSYIASNGKIHNTLVKISSKK